MISTRHAASIYRVTTLHGRIQSISLIYKENIGNYKKVLLREHKRHTACCVASTCYAALSNPDLVRGYPGYPPLPPSRPGRRSTWGTPHHPDLVGGTPGTPHHLDLVRGYPGYPPPIQTWLRGTPGTPHPDLGWGTPPELRWGTPPT